MKKIKVKEHSVIRDGGTVIYIDELNRLYYLWYPTGKIYNQWPFPKGCIGKNDTPPDYVKEIKIKLEIVQSF